MTQRVVVIGAGPAGSSAAMALSRYRHIEVLLFDRYALPRTKVCGSGLSPWTLRWLDHAGLGERVRRRAFRIDGALIGGSAAEKAPVELRGHHETAVFVRSEFDQLLAQEAATRGAQLRDGVAVRSLVRCGGSGARATQVIGIESADGPCEADAVIDCSGARGGFFNSSASFYTLHTAVGWYDDVPKTSDVVELYFDGIVKPHYGWLFPETSNRVNVGICYLAKEGQGDARQRFDTFVERRLAQRLRGANRIGKLLGHPVHASRWPAAELAQDGLLTAGEAGRLADIATAEGIYHAMVSGTLAGEQLGHVLSEGRPPTADHLRPYVSKVRRQLGARMLGGHLLMQGLRSSVLDRTLAFGQYKPVRRVLTQAFTGLYHG